MTHRPPERPSADVPADFSRFARTRGHHRSGDLPAHTARVTAGV